MNITPKNTFKGTNPDGSKFTAQEWDFATASNLELSGIMIMLVICLIFCSVASPILLLLCVWNFNGRIIVPHIIGMLVSAYFLFDCYSGWLGVTTLWLFCDEPTINVLVAINAASLLTHGLLLVFGWSIYKNVGGKRDSLFYFLAIVGVTICIGLVYGIKTTKKHKGWVERNVKTEQTIEGE